MTDAAGALAYAAPEDDTQLVDPEILEGLAAEFDNGADAEIDPPDEASMDLVISAHNGREVVL